MLMPSSPQGINCRPAAGGGVCGGGEKWGWGVA